jgi:uncharacterized protein YqfA (UPF0365 family)
MTHQDNSRMKINKEKEMRAKGISRMINEGGLGADKYYNIKKSSSSSDKEKSSSKKNKNDIEK